MAGQRDESRSQGGQLDTSGAGLGGGGDDDGGGDVHERMWASIPRPCTNSARTYPAQSVRPPDSLTALASNPRSWLLVLSSCPAFRDHIFPAIYPIA
jgi:hypothetical protein